MEQAPGRRLGSRAAGRHLLRKQPKTGSLVQRGRCLPSNLLSPRRDLHAHPDPNLSGVHLLLPELVILRR